MKKPPRYPKLVALIGLCALVGQGLAACGTVGSGQPWVIRGSRIWQDTGKPCTEELQAAVCEHARVERGERQCWSRPRRFNTLNIQDDPLTGTFEVSGTGPAVVFIGVQARRFLFESEEKRFWLAGAIQPKADAEQSALVSLAAGDERGLVIGCEPWGDVGVRVFEADGTESKLLWEFEVRAGPRYYDWMQSHGKPATSKRVPAGPAWVNLRRDGVAGLRKLVLVERDKVNTVEFHRAPGPPTILTGRVFDDATGAALSNIRVVAQQIGGAPDVQAAILTNDDGRYSLELAPGTWRVELSAKRGDESWQKVLVPGKDLLPGATTLDVRMKRVSGGAMGGDAPQLVN